MYRKFLKHVPLLIGALFVYAGLFKVFYPGQATMALESLEIAYGIARTCVVWAIVIEIYLGLLLIVRIDLRYAMAASMGMMFGFTVFMWYLSTMASPPACGCLGLTGLFNSSRHEALFGVFRNCAILWVLKLSYDHHFKAGRVLSVVPA